MIIDTHVHLFPDRLCPQTIEKLAVTDPNHTLTYYSDGSVTAAEQHMKEWGTDLGIMLPIATNPKQQKSVNDFAKWVQENVECFVSFGTIHPDAADCEEELNRIVAMGLHGLKLHPDYQGFFIDEERLMPIYQAISDRGLPVIFHTGYDPISPGCIHASPERVVRVARTFPDLKIVAAHTGGLYFDENEDAYCGCDNVMFDTAIASYTFEPKVYRRLIDRYGAEKFMFATDNPWGSGSQDIAFLKAVGLTDDEWVLISHKNAQKFLKL